MATAQPAQHKDKSHQKKTRVFTSLGAFGLSALIHAIIFLFVGSVVIFEGKIPPVPFLGGIEPAEGSLDMMEEMPLLEEEPMELATDVPQDELLPPSDSMPSGEAVANLDVIAATTTNSAFTMPTSVSGPTLNTQSLTGSVRGSLKGKGPGTGKVRMGSLFGGRGLGATALSGYLYDFKQDEDKKPIRENYGAISKAFTDSWKLKEVERFYRSKDPLQVTQIFMPNMSADLAPKAFNVEKEVQPKAWMVHYQGKISPPHSGTFRLCGAADDVLIVRVDGDIVFDGSWSPGYSNADMSEVRQQIGKSFGHGKGMFAGKWMKMRAGDVYPIEIVLGEVPGGQFMAFLMVQEKGVEYKQNPAGYPILPVFQIMPTEIPDYQVNVKMGGFEVMDDGLIFGAP